MKIETVLTVSQSKRLIAKGLKQHSDVKTALNTGTIGICRGTTCSYVAEEFLGQKLETFSYTTGLTLPPQPSPEIESPNNKMHDIIIRQGEIHMDGESVIDATKNMNSGDVIIKGANALNYNKKIAGCLIGHPAGGTVGGFWGNLYGKKIKLVIPVGLEKEITADILSVSPLTMGENPGNALMPMTGIILTELEAIKLLTGASSFQLAAGGIRGAEGAVRLLIEGNSGQISSMKQIIQDLESEPPF